jgi:hypothetical protein
VWITLAANDLKMNQIHAPVVQLGADPDAALLGRA